MAHNVGVKKLRLAFSALAVAIGVMTVVTFSVVNHSLRETELAIMQTGRADFTIAQKGTSDLLNSTIDQSALDRIERDRGVAGATGVLLGTTKLNAANPLFLEIGIRPEETSSAAACSAPERSGRSCLGTARRRTSTRKWATP